jgi:hypothetical protein
MTHKITDTPRKMALLAGFSILTMALLAGFGYGYVFQSIYAAGDSATTLTNLQHSSFLFRLFILSFVLVLILDVVLAWALYIFFQQVHPSMSLLATWFRLVYAALLGISLLPLLVVTDLLNMPLPNASLIMTSLKAFLSMWSLGLIVFGCHLVSLGYLIIKSGNIPKILGVFTLIAAVGYLSTNVANLLMTDYEQYKKTVDMALSLPLALGELGIGIWLLVKGGKGK